MARADLLVSLVKAGTSGDHRTFRSAVEAIAAEERAKRHIQLADALEANLRRGPSTALVATEVPRSFDGGHGGLLFEIEPQRPLSTIVLGANVRTTALELIEEQR